MYVVPPSESVLVTLPCAFINEISLICEYTNANAKEVEEGLKSETRIGRKAFLSPGMPFAGGTLGRDVNYLNEISKKKKLNTKLLSSIITSNENHKHWIYNHLKHLILNKKIKKVSILGLAYTENTDTLRRSLSIEISCSPVIGPTTFCASETGDSRKDE